MKTFSRKLIYIPTSFANRENQQKRVQGFKPFFRYPKSRSWKCKGWSLHVLKMKKINRQERKDSNLFLGIQNLKVENVKDDLAKL